MATIRRVLRLHEELQAVASRAESNCSYLVEENRLLRRQLGGRRLRLTDDDRVLYQGELEAGRFLRAKIPVPASRLSGLVTITATFCYATQTDPQDPLNYTRAGLEVVFRPYDKKFM